jgi:hypothetical protein
LVTARDDPALVAEVAAAIEAGMEQAKQYREAAMAKAGYGMEVRLPSVPGPAGPVVGLGYDTAPEPAPMPGNPKLTLTLNYASDLVGGSLHHGSPNTATTRSDGWPAGTTFLSSLPGARSSMTYVSASSMAPKSWPGRVLAAIKRAFGRS